MLTALILLWPTVAAALVFLTKGPAAKKVAFGATLIEFVLVMLAMFQFTADRIVGFWQSV